MIGLCVSAVLLVTSVMTFRHHSDLVSEVPSLRAMPVPLLTASKGA